MRPCNCAEKVRELRELICDRLRGKIDADYWFLDAPYHPNVGDTLIWQGERDYLKCVPHACRGTFAWSSFLQPSPAKGELVLFSGGGNFGDLWPLFHDYRKQTMAHCPESRYFFFPQTVFWNDPKRMAEDAEFFSRFDCTICARDARSYALLKEHFKNEILLVPDMAFSLDIRKWARRQQPSERPLLLKRMDKELRPLPQMDDVERLPNVEIADWVTLTKNSRARAWDCRVYQHARYHLRTSGWLYDFYMQHLYCPAIIRAGVEQIATHSDIYATRLHACILAILLGKENITLFDNAYGKNSAFYETWLKNCENVKLSK